MTTRAKPKSQTLPERYKPGVIREIDRRTELGQRLQAVFDVIVTDAGGPHGLTHTKLALIERFVWLEAMLQGIEREIAAKPEAANDLIGKWVQGVNSLTGLAKMIGLERNLSRTVDLRAYVRERQA
jgi:hypothetical protein